MRLILLRPTDTIARRFEEFNTYRHTHSIQEFVLMLKLGRRSLPW